MMVILVTEAPGAADKKVILAQSDAKSHVESKRW